MRYLITEDGKNVFYFECESCGAEGEIGVPVDLRSQFHCPEGCGAEYVQWHNPLTNAPDLMCVICPIQGD